MDGKLMAMILVAVGVAAFGVLYRKLRSGALPDVPDRRFYEDFMGLSPIPVSMETLLGARRRVAKVLGLPPEKLAVDHTYEFLSKRIGYLAELSVAWNDLADEGAEARSDAGLEPRVPSTVGELIEDLLRQKR